MTKNCLDELKKIYPWLCIEPTNDEYVEANYYNKTLKEYAFNGKTDLQLFQEWLNSSTTDFDSALELGCGTGRVTDVLFNNTQNRNLKLYLLDLSKQMLEFCKNKFSDKNVNFINSDSLSYLKDTKEMFDVVYTLWSFSHSVHQTLDRYGFDEGSRYIRDIMCKFIKENLNENGRFFLIHYDSLSEEQYILNEQRKKAHDIYNYTISQSPSLILMEQIFNELQSNNIVNFEEKHLVGDPIIYNSLDEALEIFMNFHLESFFNDREDLGEVIIEVNDYLKQFETTDKTLSIRPGCFIFKVNKTK